jgi:transcriptional regulator with XRE-family HTH domain
MLDIAAIRKELSLTQAEFAEKLGVSQGTVSRFETGSLPIDERTRLAILALKAGITARKAA